MFCHPDPPSIAFTWEQSFTLRRAQTRDHQMTSNDGERESGLSDPETQGVGSRI